MRPMLPRGKGKRQKESGYVLVEAIALMAVLAVGVTAVVGEVSSGLRTLHRQTAIAGRVIEDENAQAVQRIEDIAQK